MDTSDKRLGVLLRKRFPRELLIACPLCGGREFKPLAMRRDKKRIVQCLDCGHCYLNPPLGEHELAQIYAQYYSLKEEAGYLPEVEKWFSDPDDIYQYALRKIGEEGFAGKAILEVGCGAGRFLAECRQRGARVTGVDPSPGAARIAGKHFQLELISETVEQAAAEGRLLPSSYDIIISFETLEHLQDPNSFVRTLFDLLAPGGWLLVSTPNFYLFEELGRVELIVNSRLEHIQFFEPRTLTKLFAQNKFERIQVTTLKPLLRGERLRRKFASLAWVWFLWRQLRRIRGVSLAKKAVLRNLDSHETAMDKSGFSGVDIVLVAYKPYA